MVLLRYRFSGSNCHTHSFKNVHWILIIMRKNKGIITKWLRNVEDHVKWIQKRCTISLTLPNMLALKPIKKTCTFH